MSSLLTVAATAQNEQMISDPEPLLSHTGSAIAQPSKSSSSKNSNTTSSTSNGKVKSLKVTTPAATAGLRITSCGGFPAAHPGLATAASPELQKLAQYEQLCGGALASRSSFFLPTPPSAGDAPAYASDAASILKDYATHGVTPLVFLEPNDDNGNLLDLGQYMAGAYDTALDSYFASLKADGITDSMMGMWVALPEGDIPVWSTDDPTTYAADVTKTVQFQKKYFPASQASIMLDSESYAPGAGWGNGQYVSLLPFVQNIPAGLINSFGLQGFPWAAPANQGDEDNSYDPQAYLRIDFAAQAARALGVNNVWFNTGTFHQMYTQNPSETVTLQPLQRQTMLNGVLSQAEALQAQGFSVAIHLFAENKSAADEATDWSYWQTAPGSDANTSVLTTFVNDANVAHIPLWLFDTED
jgi:hypothetical protein